MKILRAQLPDGSIRHGILEAGDTVSFVEGLEKAPKRTGASAPLRDLKLLAPLVPVNILAFGRNYKAHAEEGGDDLPKNPLLFLKATTSVQNPGAPIRIPKVAPDLVDYEAELAVVIGREASCVPEKDALSYVLGYTCADDVSARDCQNNDGQWARGKSFDTFCPLGPWIETDLDPSNVTVRGILNDRVVQEASTSLLIFSLPYLISYISHSLTLVPGTVLLTGTPAGCGFAHKPPLYLKQGDVFHVEVDGIGRLSNPVENAK
jgi:2-keto-4-pentenoate hydratase/2-oxohepta-3-ene-1,7-dioic acid hydratase in catechol pathway